MALKSFSDYLSTKNQDPVSPFTAPVGNKSISADTEGDDVGPGDLGSNGMGKLSGGLEPVKDKAEPEYKKGGQLKHQNESINESMDNDGLHMKSMDGSKFSPPIHEVSRYVAEMVNRFPHTADKLLRESKRQGSFNHIVKSAMEHPEFFDEVSKHMSKEDGSKHARKFVKAMHGHHLKAKAHFDGLDESVDSPRGDTGMGSSMAPNPSGNFGSTMPAVAPQASEPSGFNYGSNSNMSSMAPPPALNLPPANEGRVKTAHHNMIDEMAKCEPMHNYMKECCGGMY